MLEFDDQITLGANAEVTKFAKKQNHAAKSKEQFLNDFLVGMFAGDHIDKLDKFEDEPLNSHLTAEKRSTLYDQLVQSSGGSRMTAR